METSTSTPNSGLKLQENGHTLRSIGTSPLRYRLGTLVALSTSNKNLTGGSMIIRPSNCHEYHSGSLMRAFAVLDKRELTAEVVDFQHKISTVLESRGFKFDEEEQEFFTEVEGENNGTIQ